MHPVPILFSFQRECDRTTYIRHAPITANGQSSLLLPQQLASMSQRDHQNIGSAMRIEGGQVKSFIHEVGGVLYVGVQYLSDDGILVHEDPYVCRVVSCCVFQYTDRL